MPDPVFLPAASWGCLAIVASPTMPNNEQITRWPMNHFRQNGLPEKLLPAEPGSIQTWVACFGRAQINIVWE